MKILLLDIETAPNLAYVWGLFNQNISIKQLANSGYVMSWAAQWHGESKIKFCSIQNTGKKRLLKTMHKLLDQADVVVHYNGRKFDIPTLNKEFVQMGMKPPSPYKQVDLYTVVKTNFRFTSNKMDYVAKALGLGQKVRHEGHELWVKCMSKDPKAWKRMEKYNKHDVVLLSKLYKKLLPWIKGHPSHSLYDHKAVCTNCGSDDVQKRGSVPLVTGTYQQYVCKDCGTWLRAAKPHTPPNKERLINARS